LIINLEAEIIERTERMKLAQCGHVQEMQDNQIQEMMLDD
jgi:hypothetical protein